MCLLSTANPEVEPEISPPPPSLLWCPMHGLLREESRSLECGFTVVASNIITNMWDTEPLAMTSFLPRRHVSSFLDCLTGGFDNIGVDKTQWEVEKKCGLLRKFSKNKELHKKRKPQKKTLVSYKHIRPIYTALHIVSRLLM